MYQKAQQVAANHLNLYQTGVLPDEMRLCPGIVTSTEASRAYYIFNRDGGKGFVVVAVDDRIEPVLAYATSGSLNLREAAPALEGWLHFIEQRIDYVIKTNTAPGAEVALRWQFLLNPEYGTLARPTAVQPLLTSYWNQIAPYNGMCPFSAPTGSVATAMGQVMRYWQHPATGSGSNTYGSSTLGGTLSADFGNTSYDWNNMPNSLSPTSTQAEKDAVSTLLFHCGVATETDYNVGASESSLVATSLFSPSAQNSLLSYFSYDSTITGYYHIDFTDTQWRKMLRFELDQERPVLLGAEGFEFHALVLDGYDDNEMFHVNWGWGGMSDGYFSLDLMTPDSVGVGMTYNDFSYWQEAVIMIAPAGSNPVPNPFTPDHRYSLKLVESLALSNDTIEYNTPFSITGKVTNSGLEDYKGGYFALFITKPGENALRLWLSSTAFTVPVDSIEEVTFSTQGDTSLTPGRYHFELVSITNPNLNFFIFVNDRGTAMKHF